MSAWKEEPKADVAHTSGHAPNESRIELKPTTPSPPNGGTAAWLLVLAAHFTFVNTWGLTQTFGAFQAHYKAHLIPSASSSSISWIGSVQSFLVVVVGVIAGPLFDMGYLQHLMFLGSFMIVFGMMMLSLCKQYWQIFLAQGVCVGFGAGFVYVPALAIVATQFTTRRPIAIGVASAGASIGGIIFPIMFRRLQPRVGFGWAVRSIAFINLGLSVLALAILVRHKTPKPAGKRVLFDVAAWKEPAFTLFVLALFFTFLAFYMPLFYVPSFALYNLRKSEDFAFDMLTVTNAGSFLGRILPFLVSAHVKPIQNLFFWTCAAIVLLFAWIGTHNAPGFVVWCAIYGFVSGVLVAGPAAAVVHPVLSPSMSVVGTRLGMSWATASIGILIGSPVAGALVNVRTGEFINGQAFAGAVMTVAAICLVVPVIKVTKYKAEET